MIIETIATMILSDTDKLTQASMYPDITEMMYG